MTLCFLSMMFLVRQSDEHRAEHGEHVGLDEGYQKLKTVHEQQHDDAERVESETEANAHRPSEEDDAGETQYDGMACHHIGEETDHESKRLGEHAEKLNHRHYGHGVGLQEERHLGPEDFLPVFLVAEEVDGYHRTYGKEQGDVDVSCHIGTTGEDRYQTYHIGDEDEEEHREKIGSILLVVLLAHRRQKERGKGDLIWETLLLTRSI